MGSQPRPVVGSSRRKTRSEKWLSDNIDNPFRDWDADGVSFTKAAMKAWKDALKQARAIEGAATPAQAAEIVLALTKALEQTRR
jgi:hypothetical protein